MTKMLIDPTTIYQESARQQQDIPDLIAGAFGVSRGAAYDMMREALAEQPAQPGENGSKIENDKLSANGLGPGQMKVTIDHVHKDELLRCEVLLGSDKVRYGMEWCLMYALQRAGTELQSIVDAREGAMDVRRVKPDDTEGGTHD